MDPNDIGVIVLALIHAKIIDISCDNCNDMQKKIYACTENSDTPVFEYEEYEFYTCPLKFITNNIFDFYDELSYYELFPGSAPKYGQHSITFWNLTKLYKSTYNKAIENKQSNKDTDKALNKLRVNFKKK